MDGRSNQRRSSAALSGRSGQGRRPRGRGGRAVLCVRAVLSRGLGVRHFTAQEEFSDAVVGKGDLLLRQRKLPQHLMRWSASQNLSV